MRGGPTKLIKTLSLTYSQINQILFHDIFILVRLR